MASEKYRKLGTQNKGEKKKDDLFTFHQAFIWKKKNVDENENAHDVIVRYFPRLNRFQFKKFTGEKKFKLITLRN